MSQEQTNIIDISPPVTLGMGVYPGDTPPEREVICDLGRGDVVTLSTLRSTVHVGAHLDAPVHYSLGAPAIDQQNLELCIGPCQVLQVSAERKQRLLPQDITHEIACERVLIATATYPDPAKYNDDFASLAPELVDWLCAKGVRLIGIDTPSVDDAFSKTLPTHQAVLRNDARILEGLVLSGVPSGSYELIALPLRLVGFDASPVRAVLRPLS